MNVYNVKKKYVNPLAIPRIYLNIHTIHSFYMNLKTLCFSNTLLTLQKHMIYIYDVICVKSLISTSNSAYNTQIYFYSIK